MDKVLIHHGIDGQKWGKRNGPPYPLSRKEKRRIKRSQKKLSRDYKFRIRKKNAKVFREMNKDKKLHDLKTISKVELIYYKNYAYRYYDDGYRFISTDPYFNQIFKQSVKSNVDYRKYGEKVIDQLLGKYTNSKNKEKILNRYLHM